MLTTGALDAQYIPTVQAEEIEETLEEKSDRIALEFGVSTTTVRAIVDSETGGTWNPNQEGDGGMSCGLASIHSTYHPDITCEQAKDPEFALRFIAQVVKDGNEWREFTMCSCIQAAKVFGAKIPPRTSADDFVSNSSFPVVGGLVIFRYGTVYHVAVVRGISQEGIFIKEGNKVKCSATARTISWNDSHIIGYWNA